MDILRDTQSCVVRRVLPLRQKANKARTVLADDDIHVFEE
jgi:hypothetical protein